MAKSEYDFDTFVGEAQPTPFRLRVSQDEVIEIPYPDGEHMLLVDEARTGRAVLAALCGDQWKRVFELTKHKHGKVLEALSDEMRKHFGLNGAPPGGGQG